MFGAFFDNLAQRRHQKRLEALVLEFKERRAAGEDIDHSSFLAEHPLLAQELAGLLAAKSSGNRGVEVPAAPDPLVNTEFGEYFLEEKLGEGGMARVYRAENRRTGQKAAVKVLRNHDPQDASRLMREGRITKLDHPSIVRVYDVGVVDDRPYVAMELVENAITLDQILDRDGPFPSAKALQIITEIGEALVYAHANGVVHRDVKPSNIIMDQGRARLIDFDLVHFYTADLTRLTAPGELVGTPAYMSPEQITGDERPQPTWDIYSLGATMYELLSGRMPFNGKTTLAVVREITNKDPAPLRDQGIAVPIEAVCIRCLEKNPSQRYQSAKDLLADIERSSTGQVEAPVVNWWWRRTRRLLQKNRLAIPLGAAALLVFLVSVVQIGKYRHQAELSRLRDLQGEVPEKGRDFSTTFLKRAYEEGELQTRLAATTALFRKNSPEAFFALKRIADDKDSSVRLHLVKKHTGSPNKQTAWVCEKMLSDSAPVVQSAAIRLAETTGRRDLTKRIEELSHSDSIFVRRFAFSALQTLLADDFEGFVLRYLRNGRASGRVLLIRRHLRTIPPPIPALIGILEAVDSSAQEREAAHQALTRFTGLSYPTGEAWRRWWSINKERIAPRLCIIVAADLKEEGLQAGDVLWMEGSVVPKDGTCKVAVVRENQQKTERVMRAGSISGAHAFVLAKDGKPIGQGRLVERLRRSLGSQPTHEPGRIQ